MKCPVFEDAFLFLYGPCQSTGRLSQLGAHRVERERVRAFAKYCSLNVSPSLQDVLFVIASRQLHLLCGL